MKKLLLAGAAALTVFRAAAFVADLDGTTFNIDTLYSHVVGPGITQNGLHLSANGRSFNVYTSTMIKSDNVEPRVIMGNDKCSVGETMTSMARRHNATDGYRYLTGVNGDFFITSAVATQTAYGSFLAGYPNAPCAIDRKVAAPDYIDSGNHLHSLIVTADSWYIDSTDFTYTVTNADGSAVAYGNAVNMPCDWNELVIYNSYMGAKTSALSDNVRELVLKLNDGESWCINGDIKCTVTEDWRNETGTTIPADGLVIACGPSYSNEMIDNLKVGDEVSIHIGVGLPAHDNITPDILQIIGGDVRVLNNGEITREANRWINTPSAQYQRSLVGFNEDCNMMVIAAVDGSGLTYYEAAAMMKALGCYNALDLDGGGSTAIWSNAFGIFNSPRDGSERAIADALFFALKAPVDNEVASLRFADWRVSMPLYGRYEPVIYGYNQYGELVDTNVEGFTIEVPEGKGRVDGTAFIATAGGDFALRVTKGNMSANVAVNVDGNSQVAAKYTSLLIDNYHPTPIQLVATAQGKEMSVAGDAFEWTSDNEAVATVDGQGIITGHVDGTATITGRNSSGEISVDVTVECPVARSVALSPDKDSANWTATGSGVSISSLKIDESPAMSIDFTINQPRAPKITLSRDILLFSRPDAIVMDLNAGDVEVSSIVMKLVPNGGKAISCTIKDVPAGENTELRFNIEDFEGADNPGIYPLTFKSIVLAMSAAKGSYNLTMNRLDVVYDSFVDGVESVSIDAEPTLHMAVDGRTIVLPYSVDSIELYDLRGVAVANASGTNVIEAPSAGLYILRTPTAQAKVVVK